MTCDEYRKRMEKPDTFEGEVCEEDGLFYLNHAYDDEVRLEFYALEESEQYPPQTERA